MTITIDGANGITSPSITSSGQKFGSAIFRVNAQKLNENTTIAANENANCTGPLEVANGITLIVATGGTLAVI